MVAKYHRVTNGTTQDAATMLLQALSNQVWGKPFRNNGSFPYVKAYAGPLPDNETGFEFETPVPPSDTMPHVKWYPPQGGGATPLPNDPDTCVIPVRITLVRYRAGALLKDVQWP